MIEKQIDKRNRSFLMIFVFVGLATATTVAGKRYFNPQNDEAFLNASNALMFLFIGLAKFCWFKGFYHWSIGKGYSGILAFVGALGMPIGIIVMAVLKDKAPAPPPINDPVRACPECGTEYRLGDYNPGAEEIFCSICKSELARA